MVNVPVVLIVFTVVVLVLAVVVGVSIGLGQVAWKFLFPLNAKTFEPIVVEAARRIRATAVPIRNGFRLDVVRGDRGYRTGVCLAGRKVVVIVESHFAFPTGWELPGELAIRVTSRTQYHELEGLGVVLAFWTWCFQLLFDADDLVKKLDELIVQCDVMDAVLANEPHARPFEFRS